MGKSYTHELSPVEQETLSVRTKIDCLILKQRSLYGVYQEITSFPSTEKFGREVRQDEIDCNLFLVRPSTLAVHTARYRLATPPQFSPEGILLVPGIAIGLPQYESPKEHSLFEITLGSPNSAKKSLSNQELAQVPDFPRARYKNRSSSPR